MKGKRVVGVLLWNVFNRMSLARKVSRLRQRNDVNKEVMRLLSNCGRQEEKETLVEVETNCKTKKIDGKFLLSF